MVDWGLIITQKCFGNDCILLLTLSTRWYSYCPSTAMSRMCFSPQTVSGLDQHVGTLCQAAIMHKRFGLELNVVKASSNAWVEFGHSWIHFPADPLVLCLVSCLSAFVYSSSSFRLSTSLTRPMAPQSSCPHILQACSRLASPLWQALARACWLWVVLAARPTCL